MADLTIKTFDTYPPLVATLTDQNGPIDLTEATSVVVVLKGQSGATITGQCTITDAAQGVVSYQWEDGDTDNADTYQVEWMITWPSGIQKVPNAAADNPTVEVDASLAGNAG